MKFSVCAALFCVALQWQHVSTGVPKAHKKAHGNVASTASAGGPSARTSHEKHAWVTTDAAVRRPSNITGSFRGEWSAASLPNRVVDLASVFQRSQGVVIMQLNSTASGHDDVHHVEGEFMLRDGPYMGQPDLVMKVSGVYVPASGRLHAIADPAAPLQLPFTSEEAKVSSSSYRQALHEAVRHWAHTGGSSDFVPAFRQASPAAEAGGDQGAKLREGGSHGLSRLCTFAMDLSVSVTGSGGSTGNFPGANSSAGTIGSEKGAAPNDTLAQRSKAFTQGIKPPLPPLEGDEVDTQDLVLNGTLASVGCGVSLRLNIATTRIEHYYSRAVHYSLMIAVVTFIQIALLVRQMEASAQTAVAAQLSQITIGHQALMDAYLCLLHLTTGIIVDPLFNAFATAAFLEFMLFGIFEMRWLLMAWRAQQGALLDTWQAQRQLTALYSRFYLLLLIAILMSWRLAQHVQWVVFPLCAWWLPQIALSTWRDTRQPLTPRYVVGTSAARLALPLYLLACPHNLLMVAPVHGTAASLAVFVAAQAALLVAQHRKGPRCWVPKRFLPPRYDYYRAVTPAVLPGPQTNTVTSDTFELPGDGMPKEGDAEAPMDEETGHTVECSICMNYIDIGTRSQRMVTPCAHFFHPPCLTKWMDVKLVCPVCRRALPPP